MTALPITEVTYEQSQDDDRYLALTRLCWGFVPLATGIIFAVESESGDVIASGELGQLEGDETTWLLFGDSVHPSFRRQGLHSRLIRDRCRYALERGARRCVATTYGPHTASARNYERAGFVKRPWIPQGPAEHQTEWVFNLQ